MLLYFFYSYTKYEHVTKKNVPRRIIAFLLKLISDFSKFTTVVINYAIVCHVSDFFAFKLKIKISFIFSPGRKIIRTKFCNDFNRSFKKNVVNEINHI